MEFDRAGVYSGIGFGAREAELVGLQAYTLTLTRSSLLLLCFMLQLHVSLFLKSIGKLLF